MFNKNYYGKILVPMVTPFKDDQSVDYEAAVSVAEKLIENYKKEITEDFEKIGYDVTIEKVNGLDIGMKQKRIRVFFIGNLKGGKEK